MASHAAMLLDPRTYRKQQLQTTPTPTANGNNSAESPDPYNAYNGDATSTEDPHIHEPVCFFPSLINCCPSPPDDPVYSSWDPAAFPTSSLRSHGLPFQGATPAGHQDPGHATHATPSFAPTGTVSAAQQLLHPHRRPSSRTSAKSSRLSQRESSRSSGSRSAGNGSPQRAVKPEQTLNVEFATPGQVEDGSGWQNGSTTGARHSSLIEDMYGVERRENQPRKRIKTVDPLAEEQQRAKRRNSSMTGNSGLGEWMKEDRGEIKQPSPATPNVVDLTLGMDDTIYATMISLI